MKMAWYIQIKARGEWENTAATEDKRRQQVLLLLPGMEISRIAGITQWLKGIRLSYNVQPVAANHTWLQRMNLKFVN